MSKRFTIETEKEAEGRWIAEVLELPGSKSSRIRLTRR